MGEAWSDWYALDLLHRDGLEIDDPTAAGRGRHRRLLRRALHLDPLHARPTARRTSSRTPARAASTPGSAATPSATSARSSAAPEVHSDGEIWLQTLWDLRSELLLATGSEQDASDLAEALVTEAMRLSPPEPSFLDMRNAILAADQGDHRRRSATT